MSDSTERSPLRAESSDDLDDYQFRASLSRELIAATISRYDEARAFRDRYQAVDHERKRYDPVAWKNLAQGVEDAIQSCESILAYQIERFVDGLAVFEIEGPEFQPFGVIHNGTAYVVLFDPANMAPGIIGTLEVGRLTEVR